MKLCKIENARQDIIARRKKGVCIYRPTAFGTEPVDAILLEKDSECSMMMNACRRGMEAVNV
jgi:hypothetical protein